MIVCLFLVHWLANFIYFSYQSKKLSSPSNYCRWESTNISIYIFTKSELSWWELPLDHLIFSKNVCTSVRYKKDLSKKKWRLLQYRIRPEIKSRFKIEKKIRTEEQDIIRNKKLVHSSEHSNVWKYRYEIAFLRIFALSQVYFRHTTCMHCDFFLKLGKTFRAIFVPY